jgi:acyl-[acyl-carrier-protein]-phospholipid O-acyltransferase/long-chain-fatty-acid--[acyl-carrier-protein] ligase
VPDKKRGERLVVLYLPLPGMSVKELLAKLGKVGLPNLWLPDERDFFDVPDLPLLGTGKLDLQAVKRMALERTGRADRP